MPLKPLILTFSALGAEALEHIVNAVHLEIAGKRHQRHLSRLQTESAATLLTVEVGMHVVDGTVVLPTMTIGAAHGILEHACPVIDRVNEMVSQEQGDCAVDGRLIDRIQLILEALQRESVVVSHHRAQQQDAQRRGLDLVLLQPCDIFILVLHH